MAKVVERQRSCIEPVLCTSAQRDGSIPDVRQNVIGVNFELGRTKAQPFMIASYFLAQRDVLQRRVEQLIISCTLVALGKPHPRNKFPLSFEIASDRGHALTAHGNLDRLELTSFASLSDAKLSMSFRDIRIPQGRAVRFFGLRLRRTTNQMTRPPLFSALA